MATTILLVATATRWFGTARMPRALAKAGFEVVLLTPRNSLAEHSGFVTKIGYLDDGSTPRQWLHSFAAMVKATSPRLVMPCDDLAFVLLESLVMSPPEQLQPALALQLRALIRDSLGEPSGYRASVDKLLLPAAAKDFGVRVPPHAMVEALEQAETFAGSHGYPVVLKRRQSSAGDGVAICADRVELADAFAALTRPGQVPLPAGDDRRALVQTFIRGRTLYYPSMAWQGTLLTGYAGERLVASPAPKGPASVNRYFHSPVLREMAARLARGFGITGFFSPEFVEDERTGEPYLLEINRRLVGGAHRGSAIGVDHCQALLAALHGLPSPTRADLDVGETHLTVHFPQEWLRDESSPWLREHPVDVPWDEPELVAAMLALRAEH
jgi:predicted ATP-grasp superfamily ATP-dependent carboligase